MRSRLLSSLRQSGRPLAVRTALWALLLVGLCACGQGGKDKEGDLSPALRLYSTLSDSLLSRIRSYPPDSSPLPIAVVDDSLGGMQLLHTLHTLDIRDNVTSRPSADRIADFAGEDFLFFADKVSMPYSAPETPSAADSICEVALRNALFLARQQIKALVIHNAVVETHSRTETEALFAHLGLHIPVIGVAQTALSYCLNRLDSLGRREKPKHGIIGVLATPDMAATSCFEALYARLMAERGGHAAWRLVTQPSAGMQALARADSTWLQPGLREPRAGYAGPALPTDLRSKPGAERLDPELLPVYHFNPLRGDLLYSPGLARPQVMQLNAPENYVRYYVVSLVEQLRQSTSSDPLLCVVLAAPLYACYGQVVAETLSWLRNYRSGGRYVYRHLISPEVFLVDPARLATEHLYDLLHTRGLLARNVRPGAYAFWQTQGSGDCLQVPLETYTSARPAAFFTDPAALDRFEWLHALSSPLKP